MAIRKRTKTIVALLVTAMTIVLLLIQTKHNRQRAESFLREASVLQLGVATTNQVEQLARKYNGKIESTICTAQNCGYSFNFDNRWLHGLHLAPLTRLTCTLSLLDGTLNYRRVFLTFGNGTAVFGVFVEERLSSSPGIPEPFFISRQWEGSGERWRVHVDLTANATPEQRRIAYDLNLKCLSKIGGCSDAQQLLPSVPWDGGVRGGS